MFGNYVFCSVIRKVNFRGKKGSEKVFNIAILDLALKPRENHFIICQIIAIGVFLFNDSQNPENFSLLALPIV